MGNCAAPKGQLKGQKGKLNIDLKEGEQIITYNGKQYKINVQDIYQKKENPHHNNKLPLPESSFPYLKNVQSSIIFDNKQTRENTMVNVNGKNQEFILQAIQYSSLHVRRVKSSLNDIPTINNLTPSDEQNSPIKYRNSFQGQQPIQIQVQ